MTEDQVAEALGTEPSLGDARLGKGAAVSRRRPGLTSVARRTELRAQLAMIGSPELSPAGNESHARRQPLEARIRAKPLISGNQKPELCGIPESPLSADSCSHCELAANARSRSPSIAYRSWRTSAWRTKSSPASRNLPSRHRAPAAPSRVARGTSRLVQQADVPRRPPRAWPLASRASDTPSASSKWPARSAASQYRFLTSTASAGQPRLMAISTNLNASVSCPRKHDERDGHLHGAARMRRGETEIRPVDRRARP